MPKNNKRSMHSFSLAAQSAKGPSDRWDNFDVVRLLCGHPVSRNDIETRQKIHYQLALVNNELEIHLDSVPSSGGKKSSACPVFSEHAIESLCDAIGLTSSEHIQKIHFRGELILRILNTDQTVTSLFEKNAYTRVLALILNLCSPEKVEQESAVLVAFSTKDSCFSLTLDPPPVTVSIGIKPDYEPRFGEAIHRLLQAVLETLAAPGSLSRKANLLMLSLPIYPKILSDETFDRIQHELFNACAENYMVGVRALLNLGGDLHAFTFEKKSEGLIHWAARKGNIPAIQILMGLGVDPNTPSRKGYTPKDIASFTGQTHVVEFLSGLTSTQSSQPDNISAGTWSSDEVDQLLLGHPITRGHVGYQLVLMNGRLEIQIGIDAPVSKTPKGRRTAPQEYTQEIEAMCRALKLTSDTSNCFEISQTRSKKYLRFMREPDLLGVYAIISKDLGFILGISSAYAEEQEKSAVYAFLGELPCLSISLDDAVSPKAVLINIDSRYERTFAEAILTSFEAALRKIAPPGTVSKHDQLLTLKLQKNHAKAAAHNEHLQNMLSPMFINACNRALIPSIHALFTLGANPNHSADDNMTAMHLAAAVGRIDVVETLVSLGADPHKVASNGKTPEDYAREGGHTNIALYLQILKLSKPAPATVGGTFRAPLITPEQTSSAAATKPEHAALVAGKSAQKAMPLDTWSNFDLIRLLRGHSVMRNNPETGQQIHYQLALVNNELEIRFDSISPFGSRAIESLCDAIGLVSSEHIQKIYFRKELTLRILNTAETIALLFKKNDYTRVLAFILKLCSPREDDQEYVASAFLGHLPCLSISLDDPRSPKAVLISMDPYYEKTFAEAILTLFETALKKIAPPDSVSKHDQCVTLKLQKNYAKAPAHSEHLQKFLSEIFFDVCRRAFIPSIHALVSIGVDPSHSTAGAGDDMTAMHLVAVLGRLDLVQTLVSLGADTRKVTSDNKTPQDFARTLGHTHIVEYLERLKPTSPTVAGIFRAPSSRPGNNARPDGAPPSMPPRPGS